MHHRKSLRLKDFDYSSSRAYFVTICCHNRRELFGKVANDEMCMNEIGTIALACWESIPDHFCSAELDAFVVMPNHIHGIVCLLDGEPDCRRALGAIVGGYKAAVTKEVRRAGIRVSMPVWQRGYFDRIIRNDVEWQRIREYIANNPAKWAFDRENAARIGVEDGDGWS